MTHLNIVEGASTKPFESALDAEMDKQIKHFEKELVKIRTGRAHTSMLEDVKVACYGTIMPLKEVAALAAPDVQLLTIQPWDKGIMPDIEKAISSSDLGLTPLNDGTIIRLQIPRMTTNRRDELVKVLHKKAEECKISLRNVRREVHTLIKETEKNKVISEDYSKRLQDLLQKITDKYTDLSDKLSQKKEAEIKAL